MKLESEVYKILVPFAKFRAALGGGKGGGYGQKRGADDRGGDRDRGGGGDAKRGRSGFVDGG